MKMKFLVFVSWTIWISIQGFEKIPTPHLSRNACIVVSTHPERVATPRVIVLSG